MIRLNKVNKVVLWAVGLRLLVLLIIFSVTPEWSTGLIGTATSFDDVRYEAGAMLYANTADRIIDKEAFARAYGAFDDWTGYDPSIFSATPLWYWIVCIICYIFGNIVFVRLINIIIAATAVYYLYKLVEHMYGEQTALLASRLLAFLPYPIVFSCFSYKDSLVMTIIIYLLYHAVKYRDTKKIRLKTLFYVLISALSLLLIRGGISAIFLVLCFSVALFNGEKRGRRQFAQKLCLVIIASVIGAYVLYSSFDIIVLKIQAYIVNRDLSDQGGIALVSITSLKDIYKLPIAFLFAIIMPIGFDGINSWLSVISVLNVCMAPIAIGATLDILLHNKREFFFIMACYGYYAISIVASIGIFRHYYSLLFIPIMFFAHQQIYGNNRLIKKSWKIGTVVYTAMIISYLFIW